MCACPPCGPVGPRGFEAARPGQGAARERVCRGRSSSQLASVWLLPAPTHLSTRPEPPLFALPAFNNRVLQTLLQTRPLPLDQATRDALLAGLGSLLPSHLPGAAPGAPPPAAALKAFVDGQIARFQGRVAASAAEHRLEARWWWTRASDYARAHFGSGGAAARAWAAAQVPDTVAELWGWVILVLIGAFAVSCVNALAQGQKAWEEEEARRAREARGKAE